MEESEISRYYKEYEGAKCSRNQYYKNIKQGMSREEAIKKVERRTKKGRNFSKKFGAEMKRYFEQEGPKSERGRFYQRLYQGRPKEEAIKIEFTIHHKNGNEKKDIKKYTNQYSKKESKNHGGIDIKYSKEEADVFKSFYEKMMKEIEEERFETDDIEKARVLNNRLQELKAEYQLFISVNNYYE